MTFVVLVDGLQRLPHTPKSRDSILYQVLCCLADISNSSGRNGNPFVVVCIGATLEQPINEFLAGTRQNRIFLTPPQVDGNKILQPQNDVERLMISDMGGNGCALELLAVKLPAYRKRNLHPQTVMEDIRQQVKSFYEGWVDPQKQLSVIQAVLSGQKFDSLQAQLGNSTVDSYQHIGLVRWDKETQMLDCPFIWLRVISENISDLREIALSGCALASVANNTMPSTSPIDKCWQH